MTSHCKLVYRTHVCTWRRFVVFFIPVNDSIVSSPAIPMGTLETHTLGWIYLPWGPSINFADYIEAVHCRCQMSLLPLGNLVIQPALKYLIDALFSYTLTFCASTINIRPRTSTKTLGVRVLYFFRFWIQTFIHRPMIHLLTGALFITRSKTTNCLEFLFFFCSAVWMLRWTLASVAIRRESIWKEKV